MNETPLHHHPNDGGYYPKCKRCKLNEAAPALLEALEDLLRQMDEWKRHKGAGSLEYWAGPGSAKAKAAIALATEGE